MSWLMGFCPSVSAPCPFCFPFKPNSFLSSHLGDECGRATPGGALMPLKGFDSFLFCWHGGTLSMLHGTGVSGGFKALAPGSPPTQLVI